jgi:hypothetical protein
MVSVVWYRQGEKRIGSVFSIEDEVAEYDLIQISLEKGP